MENKESQIIYFTEKLNKLRIKEMSFNSSGYETPPYLKRDMRITELALNKLTSDTKK
jgi:hypothetical protein